MARKSDIARASAEEIGAMMARDGDKTDWAKIDATTEDKLEASIAADPDDVHEELDWSKAVKGIPPRKTHVNIRIDADVLDWFKETGRGYQMRMNNVLRAFVESRKQRSI